MASKKLWCVYMHVNKINNKKYIGITSEKNPSRRWKNGYGYKPDKNANQNIAFWNAIQKYGWDNFDHIILVNNVTEEKAKELERYYIKKYETFIGFFSNPKERKGYNSTLGGEGTCGLCGKLHHNYGTHLTDKQKQIISERNSIPICEYSTNGEYIREWHSEIAACNYYGIDQKNMWELLHGIRLTMKDKVFRYKNEPFDKYRVEHLNISGENHPMYGRKHSEDSIEKMKKNRKGKASGSNNANSRTVTCDGIIFPCIKQCREYLDIPYTTLQCWLNGRNPMPQQYKKRGLARL